MASELELQEADAAIDALRAQVESLTAQLNEREASAKRASERSYNLAVQKNKRIAELESTAARHMRAHKATRLERDRLERLVCDRRDVLLTMKADRDAAQATVEQARAEVVLLRTRLTVGQGPVSREGMLNAMASLEAVLPAKETP